MSIGVSLSCLKLDGESGQIVFGESGAVIIQCSFNKERIANGCNQTLFLIRSTAPLLVATLLKLL